MLRSDQEPALKRLKEAIQLTTDAQVVCEESPVGESKLFGGINVQIQVVQGMARTLRDALESRYGSILDCESPLIP